MIESNFRYIMSYHNTIPFSAEKHTHDCYEIVYYIKGTGITRINGIDYQYNDNSFCIIPPHIEHAEWASTDTDLIFIEFDYNSALGELPSTLLFDELGDVLNIITVIRHELLQSKSMYKDIVSRLIETLIMHIARMFTTGDDSTQIKAQNVLETTVNFILSNYIMDINLDSLASSIGYSYHHFRKLFKTAYGIAPQQFIINTRVNKAKILLLESDELIENIAKRCGFNSSSQFTVTFKDKVGVTPKQFRERRH